MPIQVSYTQRGFLSRQAYEDQGGKSNTRDFLPLKLTNANVRCNDRDCRYLNETYSITHIENRDLVANPLICDRCQGKNVTVDYFKPNMLPLIYNDDNHRNTNMYDEYLKKWDNGEIHPNFYEPIIKKLKHPDFYYGSGGKALYVDKNLPMMDGKIKDKKGVTRTWSDFPWTDVTVLKGEAADQPDPVLVLYAQAEIRPIPTQEYIDSKTVYNADGSINRINITYVNLLTEYPALQKVAVSAPGVLPIRYKIYIPAGGLWNYDNFSQDEKEVIDSWETDIVLNPTGLTYSRKNDKFPRTDEVLIGSILENETYQAVVTKGTIAGGLFAGIPEEPLELFGDESGCDCWNETDINKRLPGVDPILLKEIILPPLPLFVDPITQIGSRTNKFPTNYTKLKIEKLLEQFPWITKAAGLIVDLEKKEGTLFKEIKIPAANHQLFNVIETRGDCDPCLHQNNQLFSSLLYIINQIDLDNPIYYSED